MQPPRKTEAVNLRMTAEVKELLRAAAERDHRTLSNLLEVLILEHCQRIGIKSPRRQEERRGKR